MATTPEGKVKAQIKQVLDRHGAWSFKPVSGGYGAHGIPDIIACHHGQFFGIEAKAPGKRNNVSALQKMQLNGIAKAGGIAMVVATENDLATLDEKLGEITCANSTKNS